MKLIIQLILHLGARQTPAWKTEGPLVLDLVPRPLAAGAAQGEARQLVAQAGGAARLPCPGYNICLHNVNQMRMCFMFVFHLS